MSLVERSNSTFTTQELARLAVYRAAVQAGFYTDWDAETPRPAAAPPLVAEVEESETPGATAAAAER
ncbi:MAG TPA: hypothetical protein VGQ62_08275 [Chloroflexota bacterium]|jgi:hypothetical protein|nr:hypothetical protein [Chloroflexota bacterium]